MSVRIMAQVWNSASVDGGELLVLLALADFADDDGWCWPAMITIAGKARMTDRGVRRILRRLEKKGLLICQVSRGGKGCGSRYCVTVNADPRSALEQPNPDPEAPNPDPDTRTEGPLKPLYPDPNGIKPGLRGPPNLRTTKKEKREKKEYSPVFLEFWVSYPKRLEKKAAAAKFQAAVKSGVPSQHLIEAAARYASHCQANRIEVRFIKYPATWLNKGCWDDELKPERTNGHGRPAHSETLLRVADGVDERAEAESPVDHGTGSGDADVFLSAGDHGEGCGDSDGSLVHGFSGYSAGGD